MVNSINVICPFCHFQNSDGLDNSQAGFQELPGGTKVDIETTFVEFCFEILHLVWESLE